MHSIHEAHLCECGRRLGSLSHKKHANAGFKRRKGHDMCDQCFQAAMDKARHSEHYDPLRSTTTHEVIA